MAAAGRDHAERFFIRIDAREHHRVRAPSVLPDSSPRGGACVNAYGGSMTTRHIAFVRAVMVGREGLHRAVLLEAFEEAGAGAPYSHLTTGNVSFDLDQADLDDLVAQVDASLSAVVGRAIEIFVRTLDEVRALDGPGMLVRAPWDEVRGVEITFFHEPPDLSGWQLPHLIRRDLVAVVGVDGREVYSVTRERDGETAAPGGVLERTTGQRATTRGWSTIEKIVAFHDRR